MRVWGTQIKRYPEDLESLFRRILHDGLALVEFRAPTRKGITVPETDFARDPRTLERLRVASAECGVELAYHAPQGGRWNLGRGTTSEAAATIAEWIARANGMGASIVTLHLGLDGAGRMRSIRRVAETLRAAAPRAEAHDVLLCVENVFAEHSVVDVEECLALFEMADADRVRFTLDTGHAHLAGCLFELVDALYDRLAFAHLHDNDGARGQHLVPGHGSIDWARLMAALDLYGYSGPLNMELREPCDYPRVIEALSSM